MTRTTKTAECGREAKTPPASVSFRPSKENAVFLADEYNHNSRPFTLTIEAALTKARKAAKR